jgi:hypothetical protein
VRYLFLLVVSIFSLSSFSQENPRMVDTEWFYLSASSVYAIENQDVGFAGRFSFPMQRGFNLCGQITYFSPQINTKYEEVRYLWFVELVPYRTYHFSFNLTAGLDQGFVKRTSGFDFLEPSNRYIRDNSAMFGFGVEYQWHYLSLIADHKYYPEIYSNHSSIGIKVMFFENHEIRKKYQAYKMRKKRQSSRGKGSNE